MPHKFYLTPVTAQTQDLSNATYMEMKMYPHDLSQVRLQRQKTINDWPSYQISTNKIPETLFDEKQYQKNYAYQS